MNLLKKIIEKAKKVDVFALGPSSLLYYFLIFFMVPLLIIGSGLLGLKVFNYGDLNYRSLLYLVIGFVTLALGYYSFFGKRLARKIPQLFKSDWKPQRIAWVFGVTFVLGALAKIVQFLTGGYFFSERAVAVWKHISFYSALSVFSWLSFVALIIAFVWYYHLKKQGDENYKAWRNVAWGTLIFIILYFLPTCSKLYIITPVVLVLIARWYVLKKSYAPVILAFLGILLLFPLGSICRTPNALVAHSIIQATTAERTGEAEYSVDAGQAINFAANSFFGRISQYKILQGIIENPQPLLHGEPFLSFFVSLGPPRFLWKSKPIITPDGNAFGRRIGIIHPEDRNTFIGATNVGDLYMNFGLPGIIFGMFLIGAVFRFIYEYLISKPVPYFSGIVVYGIVWVNLIKGMEHSLAPLYAGTVKFVIILLVVHLFLSWGKEDFKNAIKKIRHVGKKFLPGSY